MKRFIIIFASLWCICISAHGQAAGYSGLNYQVYAAGGAQPSYTQDATGNITNRTLLSSGIVNSVGISYSNGVLGSGRTDGFIIRFYGYLNIPTAGTYYFGGQADDGLRIKVDGVSVLNSWIESGGAFRNGQAVILSAGVVPVEVLYYENGGGEMVNFWWYINGSWQIVPTTSIATDATFWAPQPAALCCGGSSAAFNANVMHTSAAQAFVNRTTADSQVHIEQIGNSNTIIVDQKGTENNYVDYVGNGSFNEVNITQTGNNNTQANYIDLAITGNSNTVNLTQQSTGGGKGIFSTINDNNNNVTVQQKDNGSHYLNLNLSGGNKNVDILQQGSASHMANISLSGNQTGLNLTQSGSTQQFYSINHTCSTAGGCGTITVQQGQ